jgi:diaminopimelate decarboxylase
MMSIRNVSVYKNGSLIFAGRSLERLAKSHGTPLYVYSSAVIKNNLRELKTVLRIRFPFITP